MGSTRHGHCIILRVEQRIAIIHANCQGEPLASALLSSPEFARAYLPRVYLNYARQVIPEDALAHCGLLLYQHLGPEWGELSSASVLSRLPAGCPSLCIPNMFFRGPWPLWSGAPGFDYRDVFLDRLLEMNLPGPEILRLYLTMPLERKYDLAAMLEETIARERAREAHTPLKYLDFILEHWRTRPLFLTVNHPGPELLARTAAAILRHLGMAPPAAPPQPHADYTGFELPVHPQVAACYGLEYGGPQATYRCYATTKTFAQYAAAYVDCRLSGIDDFIAYLHLR